MMIKNELIKYTFLQLESNSFIATESLDVLPDLTFFCKEIILIKFIRNIPPMISAHIHTMAFSL